MTRIRDYCRCEMRPVVDGDAGIWRFDGREGGLLRFRLWQFQGSPDRRTAHATTETYTTPAAMFWRGPRVFPQGILAEVLDGMTNADAWTALTCTEIEAVALLIARAGFEAPAARIIAAHAEGDELGDQHYPLMEASA